MYPKGIIEYVLTRVDKFIFILDFVVLEMEEDHEVPLRCLIRSLMIIELDCEQISSIPDFAEAILALEDSEEATIIVEDKNFFGWVDTEGTA